MGAQSSQEEKRSRSQYIQMAALRSKRKQQAVEAATARCTHRMGGATPSSPSRATRESYSTTSRKVAWEFWARWRRQRCRSCCSCSAVHGWSACCVLLLLLQRRQAARRLIRLGGRRGHEGEGFRWI